MSFTNDNTYCIDFSLFAQNLRRSEVYSAFPEAAIERYVQLGDA